MLTKRFQNTEVTGGLDKSGFSGKAELGVDWERMSGEEVQTETTDNNIKTFVMRRSKK